MMFAISVKNCSLTRLFARFFEAIVGEILFTRSDLSMIDYDDMLSFKLVN